MRLDVQELDRHVITLREQAERLEKLSGERGYKWAEVQARQLRRIADFLLNIRREHQMTGMNGQRIG